MKHTIPPPREKTLHHVMVHLFRTHRKKAQSELLQMGLTPGQPKILIYLSQHDGCIQRDLADYCHLEPASVTSALSSMEKNGLIERKHNPKDKRILNVFITEKGSSYLERIDEVFNAIDQKCFRGFSEEEQQLTIQFLNRMYQNLL